MNRETIREVFLRNGFTIKEGQTDLKPYVYAAAEELVRLAAMPSLMILAHFSPFIESEIDDPRNTAWVERMRDQLVAAKRNAAWDQFSGRLFRDSAVSLTVDQVESLIELIENGDFSTGYCCCGSKVDSHGIGDGHNPVDQGDHHAGYQLMLLRDLLGKAKK